jgi:hypothetical protein
VTGARAAARRRLRPAPPRCARFALASLVCALPLFAACVVVPAKPAFRMFEPAPDDAWKPRIRAWQASERLDARAGPDPTVPHGPLAANFEEFTRALRAEIVARTVAWAQSQAGLYYRDDANGDLWPTFAQVLAAGGDDCDGLDLLVFRTLRSVGFAPGEIYRAVIADVESGEHHMVTLWFDRQGATDPIVLDATGWVAMKPVPLSQLRRWHPVALFDETEQFRAQPLPVAVGAGSPAR